MSANTPPLMIPRETWARMSWHARQSHIQRLENARRDLEQRLARTHAKTITQQLLAAEETLRAGDQARRILNTLPPDPDAAQHRADLWQATRKDPAA